MPLEFFTDIPDLSRLVNYIGRHIPSAAELAQQEALCGGNKDDDADTKEEEKEDIPAPALTELQQRYVRMSAALCEVVDDYNLVSFLPMNIEDVQVRNQNTTKTI